ncbi:M23 family metallopeptidase [Rappaport israeli]|uniref:M23 family metallopeptidase n=1 Tax=Rappaport israeli TaxID=1839807 RepID=UPI00093118DA|nr:M23 family metallopeptidase [Rappaport israeli]
MLANDPKKSVAKRLLPWLLLLALLGWLGYTLTPHSSQPLNSNTLETHSSHTDPNLEKLKQLQSFIKNPNPSLAIERPTIPLKLPQTFSKISQSNPAKGEQNTQNSANKPINSGGQFIKHLAIFEKQRNYWQYIHNNEDNQTLIKQLEPLKKRLSRGALTRVEILSSDYVKNGETREENSRIIAVRGIEGKSQWIFYARFEKGQVYYYDYDGNAPEPTMDRAPLSYSHISSPFDPARRHPITGRIRPHEGVDFKAPYASPIHSTGDGVVSYTGWQHGYGRVIFINHPNGYQTRYAHLSAIDVSNGQRVKRGQVIGKLGNSGISTGHHLHYEVRVNGQPQDPMTVALPSHKPIKSADLAVWQYRAEQYQQDIEDLKRSGYTVN